MTTDVRPLSALDRRQFLERAAALGISLPAASALLAACGSSSSSDATGGSSGSTNRTLTIRLIGDMTNLDPAFFANTSVDEPVMSAINEGLITYKPNLRTFDVVNQLAETFTPSADGLTFDFTLKKGIMFHGGYGELTSEDVKFSYERIADPKLDAPYAGDWKALKEVQIKDKYSGTIVLKEPFAALLHSTLPVTSGYILSKKAVEKLGKDYATHPIGTGPYEFSSWNPKQKIELKRNDNYKTGFVEQPWAKIDFLPIEEDNSADIAIETGAANFGQIGLESVGRFEQNNAFDTTSRPTLAYVWIGMNILHPKLRDINVRQAIRYGVDVPSMLQAAFEGKYQRANAIIPQTMGIGYWPDAPEYNRDVNKAKGYLQAAGLSSLDLTFSYTEEPGANAVAQILQANLKDVGINIKLDKTDSGTYYDIGKQLRSRELFWGDYETEPDPSFSLVWFTCPQIDQWNWMYACTDQFDSLQAQGLHETDDAKRTAIYIQMQKLMDAQVDAVWLAFSTHYYAYNKNLIPGLSPHGRILPHAMRPA
jgi:peptide/nickel transport system substrate-binding protein